ncbi:MAG: argininosuccinate lyase [Elusimicrobia bacterium]|nr:argininosuccinate lyase [Elusimicrobiota bacterium]
MILRGGRLGKDLREKIAEFTSSAEKDIILASYDILQSRVHAAALEKAGYIEEKDLKEINSALDKALLALKEDPSKFVKGFDDIHMAVESFLGEPGRKLHAGRSRNDQVACDMRLFLRDSAERIIELLSQAVDALEQKIKSSDGKKVIMPSYTHLQRAQPVDLATYLGVYINWFKRDSERFSQLKKRLNLLPLGSGAGASTNIKLDRNFIAKELGFEGLLDNPMDAVSSRDHMLEFSSACAILGSHISRMAEEFVILSTKEFSFIELDESIAETSSIMPQKKNPDCIELMRSSSGRLNGALVGLLTVMKGLPLMYNRDMQDDRIVFDSAFKAETLLDLIPDILENISFNPEKMGQAARVGFTDAADFAEYLVIKGMDFRDAHREVGRLVSEGISKGYENFSDYPLEDLQKEIPQVETDLKDFIKTENAVARRLHKR